MRIIKTQQDLINLYQMGALPTVFLNHIKDYFNQLRIELEVEEETYIVVFEATDNVRNLDNVGLNNENGGLLSNCSN